MGKNGTEPTSALGNYMHRFPASVPIPGPYLLQWPVLRGVHYIGIFGYFIPRGIDVFEPAVGSFQLEIGINHYPGQNGAFSRSSTSCLSFLLFLSLLVYLLIN